MAVFDNNAAAQDFIIQQDDEIGYNINHIKITGQTDKFFFLPMTIEHA